METLWLEVKIKCDDGAISSDYRHELSRVLHDLASRVEAGNAQTRLLDINGNTVGISRFVRR